MPNSCARGMISCFASGAFICWETLGFFFGLASQLGRKFEPRRFGLRKHNNEVSERPNKWDIEIINKVRWLR